MDADALPVVPRWALVCEGGQAPPVAPGLPAGLGVRGGCVWSVRVCVCPSPALLGGLRRPFEVQLLPCLNYVRAEP